MDIIDSINKEYIGKIKFDNWLRFFSYILDWDIGHCSQYECDDSIMRRYYDKYFRNLTKRYDFRSMMHIDRIYHSKSLLIYFNLTDFDDIHLIVKNLDKINKFFESYGFVLHKKDVFDSLRKCLISIDKLGPLAKLSLLKSGFECNFSIRLSPHMLYTKGRNYVYVSNPDNNINELRDDYSIYFNIDWNNIVEFNLLRLNHNIGEKLNPIAKLYKNISYKIKFKSKINREKFKLKYILGLKYI